ncbi:hypothetical protein [Spirulina sp. CS-785/01]|uniref:hypothetical protein n=1 Tax=Spirulina sp. CS-785/01 TaxID=3021716 RepID=UPI003FA73852
MERDIFLLVIGYFLLVIGYLLLVIGYLLLIIGFALSTHPDNSPNTTLSPLPSKLILNWSSSPDNC